MSTDRKKRDPKKTGKGFCLLPWGELLRTGDIVDWPNAAIAVLPVLAIHANENNEAWPSYDRICALTKSSKSTVAQGLKWLIENGWIEKSSEQCNNTHNKYRILFEPYDGNSHGQIAIYRKLIESGIWGAMRPSERRVYLIFRAFAHRGIEAIPHGYVKDPDVEPIKLEVRGKWKEFEHTEVQFLPAHVHDPAWFAELSGVNARTFREARQWLIEECLIYPYICDQDRSIAGFIMPFEPGIYFQEVLNAVERAKEKTVRAKAAPGSNRSFTAISRRANLGK